MRVALTGTPGVGKTSAAAVAARNGWRVVDVKSWAQAEGCVVGHDDADEADVIEIDALAQRVARDDGSNVLYEGHLSHLLPVDQVWLIRCDPDVLRGRLQRRGYSAGKVLENLEAEALDIILQEALDAGAPVVQRDGTRRSPEALFQAFVEARLGAPKGNDLEAVDWSDRLPFA